MVLKVTTMALCLQCSPGKFGDTKKDQAHKDSSRHSIGGEIG